MQNRRVQSESLSVQFKFVCLIPPGPESSPGDAAQLAGSCDADLSARWVDLPAPRGDTVRSPTSCSLPVEQVSE